MLTISEIIEDWREKEKKEKDYRRQTDAYVQRAVKEVSQKGFYTAGPLNHDKMETPFTILLHPLPDIVTQEKLFHNHDFFELVYVYRGQCYNCIDNYEVILKEGDLLFLNPNVIHCLYTTRDTDAVFNFLISEKTFTQSFISMMTDDVLSNFVVNYFYQMHKMSDYILVRYVENSPLYTVIDNLIIEYFEKNPGAEAILSAGLIQCFGYMARNYSSELPIGGEQIFSSNMYPVLLYVYRNYKTVTLKETAYTFSYNEKYLSKLFQKEFGMSFSMTLRKIRLLRAKELLEKTTLTVEQIAIQVGFQNLTHFYKIFKQEYSVSPAEFRRSQEG